MSGTTSFFTDCASYQGVPSWAKVAAVCIGGAEKVTEGTGYANPYWADSKAGLKQAAAHGFVPMAYMFLDPSAPGASQARWFASKAGDLAGFAIAVDFERSAGGSPTIAQARDCAAELRSLYPRHPIGGYCPHWYTGGEDLSFCDWLWASEYVNGFGDPGMLYAQVPATWWAPYGGKSPLMLQFTQAASITGVVGPVDCSAFHGTAAQLAAAVLPSAPRPVPPPAPVVRASATPGDGCMLLTLAPGQVPVTFPVWADAASYHENPAYGSCSLVVTGGSGAVVKVTAYPSGNAVAAESIVISVQTGKAHVFVPARPWSAYSVIEVKRLDSKAAVPASAAFRTW